MQHYNLNFFSSELAGLLGSLLSALSLRACRIIQLDALGFLNLTDCVNSAPSPRFFSFQACGITKHDALGFASLGACRIIQLDSRRSRFFKLKKKLKLLKLKLFSENIELCNLDFFNSDIYFHVNTKIIFILIHFDSIKLTSKLQSVKKNRFKKKKKKCEQYYLIKCRNELVCNKNLILGIVSIIRIRIYVHIISR